MNRTTRFLIMLALACATNIAAHAESPADFFTQGKIFGELRYRYENISQDGLPHTAEADTLRGMLGFETGTYRDFNALVEGMTVRRIGEDNFNDTTNGKTTFPIIADPENNRINQAWVMWSGIPNASIKAGRQLINLDNQRFIGSVNWRQSDQSFDATMVSMMTPERNADFSYTYIWNVKRVYGMNNPVPDYSGPNHLIHAGYFFGDWLKVTGYDYLFDIHQSSALSSKTIGCQMTGTYKLNSAWKASYLAEYAAQSNYDNNPGHYRVAYYHLSPSLGWKNITIQAGLESLGGDGSYAFQTPYATLHTFNGWADKFLTTPADGLNDAYGRLSYTLAGSGNWTDGITFDAVYHDFNAEHISTDYGREWDFQASKSFAIDGFDARKQDITLTAKYADYTAQKLFTDTKKVWFMADFKF